MDQMRRRARFLGRPIDWRPYFSRPTAKKTKGAYSGAMGRGAGRSGGREAVHASATVGSCRLLTWSSSANPVTCAEHDFADSTLGRRRRWERQRNAAGGFARIPRAMVFACVSSVACLLSFSSSRRGLVFPLSAYDVFRRAGSLTLGTALDKGLKGRRGELYNAPFSAAQPLCPCLTQRRFVRCV